VHRRLEHIEGKLYTIVGLSDSLKDKTVAGTLFGQGLAAEERDDPTNALRLYAEVLTHDPTCAAAWINTGRIFFTRSDFSEAERCFRKALELKPSYALAHFDLAVTLDKKITPSYLEKKAILQEVITHYLAAVRSQPNYADAHFNLALAYVEAYLRGKAICHYHLYLQYSSSSGEKVGRGFAQKEIERLKRELLNGSNLQVVARSVASIDPVESSMPIAASDE
jgi:tetratricopeptide (TPR) repeat protein